MATGAGADVVAICKSWLTGDTSKNDLVIIWFLIGYGVCKKECKGLCRK